MKKILLSFLVFFTIPLLAQTPLGGFSYGSDIKPIGDEWQSPEKLAYNKEMPRSWFYPFQDKESARKVLPENSKYWMSLDGTWKFNWVPNPDERPLNFYEMSYDASSWDDVTVPMSWNMYGIQKDGSLKYGTPIYVNQPVIFKHTVKPDDWRGGVMRTPPTNWTTYKARNEVGSYLRKFKLPTDWDGREVFISFDGVDSFFYLWINGKYVGFSKNSRNAARFNITPYLSKKSENSVAVEVYRNSDGSFLEAQDMFRLPGIFRTVSLYSTPQVQIRDLVVIPDLTDNYTNGVLNIKTDIRNYSKKNVKNYKIVYSLFANTLYSDDNVEVEGVKAESSISNLGKGTNDTFSVSLKVNDPKKWSGETPYRYTLVAELKDNKGKTIETVSTYVGFRKVEIKDTKAEDDEFGLAGRYFYVNGKTIKLKGVNRHETNPSLGHAITHKQMEEEVMMMKRANINHVRCSHYPDNPYWYYLCNKYGIYLEDEANVESHEYYYGAASLSHPVEWKNAHVARNMEMVHSDVNNPCVVIWSLGNEAGPGKNFVAAYDAIKAFDTSRPVQYERNNDIVDMGSNQYPSIKWVQGAVQGKYDIKYPFHISEYAHSMGNAVGGLSDYWKAIESTDFFCGGAIWDWIDQSMYNYTKDGKRYLAYGGDYGDTPNDGQFVMNGIIFGDMEPKPQYYEVKKVYQYVGVKMKNATTGLIEVFNKNYFTSLNDYQMCWSLYENGNVIQHGNAFKGARNILAPREKQNYTIPYDLSKADPKKEYFVVVQFLLGKNMPWATAGYVQAEEQLQVSPSHGYNSILTTTEETNGKDKITAKYDAKTNMVNVIGNNFVVNFDTKEGTIYNLAYNGRKVIEDGNGPRLNAFRAFTNNDNWFYSQMFENGLHNLKHKATKYQMINRPDGTIMVCFTVESQAPNAARILGGTASGKNKIEELTDRKFGDNDFKFTTTLYWTVYKDGSIELESAISSNNASLTLPRIGYEMKLPTPYNNMEYYGRGPIENYGDRKTGSFIAKYNTTVQAQMANFPKPQDVGNHEDCRWVALTNNSGDGILVVADKQMCFQALPYSALDMTLAGHQYQLPKSDGTYLHIDAAVTGLGGNSCGQGGPTDEYVVKATPRNFGFIIRPASSDFDKDAQVATAGQKPINMNRDRTGLVTLSSQNENSEIYYSVNGNKKAQKYNEPINLRNGGTISAWYKDSPTLKSVATYNKIDRVNAEIVFASSQETDGGEATNLTDGDANTIWHTMYSVTVAKYPHWIDFDCGSVKVIKGFNYLPRQDGDNGNIKDYKVQISNDGKIWSDAVFTGTFANNRKEKQVRFDKTIKARYLRFTALSSQNGADFASGAEFSIIAE